MEQNTTSMDSFMSAEIKEISAALCAFHEDVEQPKLNKTNPYFKSRYVDLSGVLDAVQKPLVKHGLNVTQLMSGDSLITLLTHTSGQWFKSVCPIGSYKTQQDRGSAITYTKRYAICAMLGIAADVDDDGNSATDADKSAGRAPSSAINDPKAILKAAIAEINAVKSESEFNNVWNKWACEFPQMCVPNSQFWNEASKKRSQINHTA